MADNKTVYISFTSEISIQTVEYLLGNIASELNDGAEHIYLMISSMGGDVNSALAAYNNLKGLSIKVTTHNVGSVQSTANMIFLAGQRRVATTQSYFLLHRLHWPLHTPQVFWQEGLEEIVANLSASNSSQRRILADETALDPDDISALDTTSKVLIPDEALKKGIIHDIAPLNIPEGAKYVQVLPVR